MLCNTQEACTFAEQVAVRIATRPCKHLYIQEKKPGWAALRWGKALGCAYCAVWHAALFTCKED